MDCGGIRASLGAYALGGLETGESAEVRRHLEACAFCQAELRELEAVRHALGSAPHPVDPPPYLQEKFLSRVRAESLAEDPKWKRTPRRIPFVAASLVALVALMIFSVILVQSEERSAIATVRLDPVGVYASGLQSNGYWGVAEFYPGGSRNERMVLKLNNLRPLDHGNGIYKTWIVSRDRRLYAGTFKAEPSGKTKVWLTVPTVAKGQRTVLVTRKSTGSPSADDREVVLKGQEHPVR